MVPARMGAAKFKPSAKVTALYTYLDRNANILFHVTRRDLPNGGKDILPYTYGILDGKLGWHCRRGNPPLPLYGLRRLALAPDDYDVFLVEGEKAACALNQMLIEQNYAAIAMTWPGGTDNVEYIDWSPLRERSVIPWPDADDVGLKAMNRIQQILAEQGTTFPGRIYVSGLPAGFDAADLTTPLEPFLRERCR